MARTFVAELILRLQDQMSGRAKNAADNVSRSIGQIERNARRLNSAPWGSAFQRQLDRLKLSAGEIDAVRSSWTRLDQEIRRRNLRGALRRSEISGWKTATVSHFAAVRAAMDTTEQRARRHARMMQTIMRPAYVALGGYTGAYIGGLAMRGAARAASEKQRQQAESKFAGLSEDERQAIKKQAETLAERYRLFDAEVLEMIKDAALNMPSTDAALEVSESMAQALLVLSSMFGSDQAIEGLRRFNRAMDNVEKIQPDEYIRMLDSYMKAQQVIGQDMDPSAWEQAIKYSRASGKVHSEEYLTQWLPLLISQLGGSNAGTVTRAAFDQFIVGRASKQSLKSQERYGVREGGKLIGEDIFGNNPIKWVNEVLLPQIKESGIDTENEVELARVIGEITNNRMSSDLLMTAVLSYEQMVRIIEERMKEAYGLRAASEVQDLNPFASGKGFADAWRNVASAVGEHSMPTIVAGLNTFSDALNRVAKSIREADPGVAMGGLAAGAIAGGYGVYKSGLAIHSLITAGAQLQTAATMLQNAAGRGGAASMIGGKARGKGGKIPSIGMGGVLGYLAAGGLALYNSPTDYEASKRNRDRLNRALIPYTPWYHWNARGFSSGGPPRRYAKGREGREREAREWVNPWAAPAGDVHVQAKGLLGIDQAEKAGDEIKEKLGVTAEATVHIDTSPIQAAITQVDTLLGKLAQVGSASAGAKASTDRAMRRNFSDYGVAP